jgi:hypothetical protein
LRAAVTAQHFVTFGFLAGLILEVLFADSHLALWALLSASLAHPSPQALFSAVELI